MDEQKKNTYSLKQEIVNELNSNAGDSDAQKHQQASGIGTLIKQVQTVRDAMQEQWIESLTMDLEQFYRGAFREMNALSANQSGERVEAVANMMKYLSMGKVKGLSPERLKRSLDSSRQLEEQVAKAEQNFEIKSTGLRNLSEPRSSKRDKVNQLQNIAMQHGINQEDVGLAYRVGSRKYDSSSEAVHFAAETAKIQASGSGDVEQTATGLEAISSLWSAHISELSKMTDMIIHASSMLHVSVQELMSKLQQTDIQPTKPESGLSREERMASWISQAALSIQTDSSLAQYQTSSSNRVQADLLAEQLKASVETEPSLTQMETKDHIVMQQKKWETIFQISTHRVMQSLNEDFAAFGNVLVGMLRLIENQSGGVVDHMELLNRIMDDVGVQVDWEKVGQFMDQADQKRYGPVRPNSQDSENLDTGSMNHIQGVEIQRAGAVQEMKQQQHRLQHFQQQKAELTDKTLGKQTDLTKAKQTRDANNEKRNFALQQGDAVAAALYATEQQEAERKVRTYARELFLLREEMYALDTQIAKTKRNLQFLSREVDDTGKSIMQLEHQSRRWLMAMNDMDLETVDLRNKLYYLNTELQYGATDIQRYESDVEKLRRESGKLNDALTKLRSEVNELNASFKKGLTDASAYIAKLKELEQVQLGLMMNGSGGGLVVVPGTGTGASPAKEEKKESENKTFVARHEDLIKDVMKDAIMDGVDYGGKKDNKVKKRGLVSRFKDMKETGNRKAFFNNHAPMRDPSGNILKDRNGNVITEHAINAERAARGIKVPGKLSKLVKFGSRLVRPLKAVPALGGAMLAMDVISGLVDPLSNMGKSEAEKQNIRATNKEELAKDFKDMKDSSFVGKVWKGFNLGMDALVSGTMSSIFGNSATNNKFGDYAEGFKALWTEKDGAAVDKKLAKEYNYEQEKKESQLQMDKEAGKSPANENQPQVQNIQPQVQYIPAPMQDVPAAGAIGAIANGAVPQPKGNGIEEMIDKINRQLSISASKNETNYQVTRSRLLISGVREDSGQMRALMEKYLQENIKFFDKAIASLQKTYDKLAEGKEKEDLGMEINEKKQQKAQSELELNSVKNSKIDELKRKMSDQLELTQMDYDKRMYDLLAANGGKEDSSEVIALNKARARDMNLKMDLYKQQWNELLKNGGFNVNSDEYMTILKELSSIGVEQSKNLAEISKKMDKPISTFNLPAGLKVMDYFDYMTAGNTHKSVMVGSGDVTVHVNIDNMTGSTKDVEKLTSALDKTLRQNNPGISNRMAGNVGAGMGSMYGPR
ncbi:hypothetical protein [Paenibacillus sp. TC-CSREp1]|uniref:hypothetical protein n=1 Tax=Paenibacillus sp. TC-CSREp1 TaxID=3410089 RepID=UPI003CF53E7D